MQLGLYALKALIACDGTDYKALPWEKLKAGLVIRIQTWDATYILEILDPKKKTINLVGAWTRHDTSLSYHPSERTVSEEFKVGETILQGDIGPIEKLFVL